MIFSGLPVKRMVYDSARSLRVEQDLEDKTIMERERCCKCENTIFGGL